MQHTGIKSIQNLKWLGGKGDPLGIVQEIKIDHITKWYMHKPESVLKNEIHKILWDFEILTN